MGHEPAARRPAIARRSGAGDSLGGARALWLGFKQGGVAHFTGDKVAAVYSARDGLAAGEILHLRFDSMSALWTATKGGLTRIKGASVATLSSKNGLPCDTVHWSIEDDALAVWVYTACGLVRIDRAELDAWTAAVEGNNQTKRGIEGTVFDSSDGVRSNREFNAYTPRVTKTADGRLWFLPIDGVSVVDPHRLGRNNLPPPIYVERIVADHSTYDGVQGVRLPPHVRDLQIDYTALILVAPEKNRFRIKLEGRDQTWLDVGSRRQAFYTDLGPGTYYFRVVASNNSGVWNESGTTLEFSIAPAYYQTRWFQAALALTAMALVWLLVQLRIRQVARQFNRTLDARVSERTRIARALHDTLLQSFQGVLLRFQSVEKILPPDAAEARQRLDRALDEAEAAVTEGRNAVQGLRVSATTPNDLASGIAAMGAELTSNGAVVDAPIILVSADGETRDLNSLVRDEAYRVTAEALRNAIKHAQARLVTVTIHYEPRRDSARDAFVRG